MSELMRPCPKCKSPTEEGELWKFFKFYGEEMCRNCGHEENRRQRIAARNRIGSKPNNHITGD